MDIILTKIFYALYFFLQLTLLCLKLFHTYCKKYFKCKLELYFFPKLHHKYNLLIFLLYFFTNLDQK